MTETAKPDLTTPEQVERLISEGLTEIARSKGMPVTADDVAACELVAATIRALADKLKAYDAERDALDAAWSERVALLEKAISKAEDERDDAEATLNAWFDRRKLAHEAIDETVLNAARGYLRTSRSGGMDKEQSDMIEGVIEDMARLSVFADLFARAALDKDRAP